MLTVFQVCFFTGLGLIVLSFVLGSIMDASGFDGLDLDFEILSMDLFLPINPTLIMLFSTVFGGVGWLLLLSVPWVLLFVVLVAGAAAFLTCAFVHFLVIKPLKNAQNTSAPTLEELIGLRAKVTETIIAGGFGEIRYVIHGNSYSAPAKSTSGDEIKAGSEVAICWIKDHVYYVVAMETK
ncbi:MAG: hypothetical protein GX306_06360 [Clostridiales bacterium]|jgi:membrane protein implicated in regulation of membrane protease activity|nr:hypothetical protein [Clostridiales bacterium]